MEIKFHITRKCNLKCKYCIVDQSVEETNYDFLLDQEINKCIQNNVRIDKLLITGGEPSLQSERVYKILDKYKWLDLIVVISNGTNLEFARRVTKYKNVKFNVSWDGASNERGFDSINTVKTLVEEFPNKIPSLSYVVENNNYFRLYDDMMILKNIDERLLDAIDVSIVKQRRDYYEIDEALFYKEIKRVARDFPMLNLFQRGQSKSCPHTHEYDRLISIDNGEVRYGCLKYIYLKDDTKKCFEDACLNCNVDICNVCSPALEVMKVDGLENRTEYIDNPFCRLMRLVFDALNSVNKEKFFLTKLLSYTAIELDLTDACNMRCRYCFQGSHDSKHNVMSENIIDNVIDLIQSFPENNKPLPTIMVIGGEVMFGESLVRLNYLIDKLIDANLKCKFMITTNCYLMNDLVKSTYKKLLDNDLIHHIQVSLDCGRDGHNLNRVDVMGNGTYDIILNNMIQLSKIVGYKYITVNTVVTPENVTYLKDHLMFMETIMNRVIHNYSTRIERQNAKTLNLRETSDFRRAYNDIIKSYLMGDLNKHAIRSAFNVGNLSCDSSVFFNDHACGMIRTFVGVSVDGEIIPCNGILTLPNYKEKYVIGTLNDDLNISDNIYDIYDEFDVDNKRRCNGESCECCYCFETCFSCRTTNILLSGHMNENHGRSCMLTRIRWKEFADNVNLMDFKTLTDDEKHRIINDINDLREMYDNEKDILSESDKLEVINTLKHLQSILGDK